MIEYMLRVLLFINIRVILISSGRDATTVYRIRYEPACRRSG